MEPNSTKNAFLTFNLTYVITFNLTFLQLLRSLPFLQLKGDHLWMSLQHLDQKQQQGEQVSEQLSRGTASFPQTHMLNPAESLGVFAFPALVAAARFLDYIILFPGLKSTGIHAQSLVRWLQRRLLCNKLTNQPTQSVNRSINPSNQLTHASSVSQSGSQPISQSASLGHSVTTKSPIVPPDQFNKEHTHTHKPGNQQIKQTGK